MTSHGVTRTVRSRTDEQRKQDAEKIDKYQALEGEIRTRVSQNSLAPETYQLTSKLLKLNPEYYTIWNVRRRCLISGLLSRPSASSSPSKESSSGSPTNTRSTFYADASSSSSAAATRQDPGPQTTGQSGTTADPGTKNNHDNDLQVLQGELYWMIPLLMEFPKCYWIWNYRLWVLDQAIKRLPVTVSRGIWEEELGLTSKMLTKDRRNFHAWGYRRHLVATLESEAVGGKSMAESEFEYTTRMIRVDLSNFSAWHNRSKLIPRLLSERNADDQARQKFLETELDQVREGLNVGPEDQSLWYYHQFLVLNLVEDANPTTIAPNLTVERRSEYVRREIDDIKDFLEDYDDIKWIYEVLLEYTLALVKLEKREQEPSEKENLKDWLSKLRKLDPMRKGRWDDMEKEYGLKLA